MVERVLAKDEAGVRFSLSALEGVHKLAKEISKKSGIRPLFLWDIVYRVGDNSVDTGDKGHVLQIYFRRESLIY